MPLPLGSGDQNPYKGDAPGSTPGAPRHQRERTSKMTTDAQSSRHADPNKAIRLDTLGRPTRWGDPEERFFNQIHIIPNGCWLWTGRLIDQTGYALFSPGRRRTNGHRWAYEHFIGPIPAGMQIDHRCHTSDPDCSGGPCIHRRCLKPAHLEPVSARENARRGRSPAAITIRTNVCQRGHEFTLENTYIVPSTGKRRCRMCMLLTQRARNGVGPTSYRIAVSIPRRPAS